MKQFLYLFILLAGRLIAQDKWLQKTPFTGTGRMEAFGFSIGSKAYVGGGYNNDSASFINSFWEYDTLTTNWTRKADLPAGKRINAVSFSIGSKGYVATGNNGNADTVDLWEYDPGSDLWSPRAKLPGAARSYAIGFSIGNKGYLGLGATGTIGNADLWQYDPLTNSWIQKANFPGLPRQSAAAFSIGGKAYVGLGGSYSNEYNDLWEYDTTNNAWTQKAAFPGSARVWTRSFTLGNSGYVFGGEGNGSYFINETWNYDPQSDTWTSGDTLPKGIMSAVGFSIGNKGYCLTGYDGVPFGLPLSGGSTAFWEYVPASVNAISEREKENIFSICPNPVGTNGILIVKCNNEPAQLEINNSVGELVFKQRIEKNKQQINISDLPAGIYSARLAGASGKIVKE